MTFHSIDGGTNLISTDLKKNSLTPDRHTIKKIG